MCSAPVRKVPGGKRFCPKMLATVYFVSRIPGCFLSQVPFRAPLGPFSCASPCFSTLRTPGGPFLCTSPCFSTLRTPGGPISCASPCFLTPRTPGGPFSCSGRHRHPRPDVTAGKNRPNRLPPRNGRPERFPRGQNTAAKQWNYGGRRPTGSAGPHRRFCGGSLPRGEGYREGVTEGRIIPAWAKKNARPYGQAFVCPERESNPHGIATTGF